MLASLVVCDVPVGSRNFSKSIIGLWHEIQNRLKYTWFDVVFYVNSDSIFF